MSAPPTIAMQRLIPDEQDLFPNPAGQPFESSDELPPAKRPWQVLIVEDLPRIQRLIREVIETPGQLEVAGFVTNAQEAIDAHIATHPQALIVDLHLTEGSGIDVIKAVRRQCDPSDQPLIIVLTNHATPQLELACRRVGADFFLDKSKDFARVRQILLDAFHEKTGAGSQ